MGSAGMSRSAWSVMASRWPVCRRSCLSGLARSPLARDVKPVRPVRIPWRWPGCTAGLAAELVTELTRTGKRIKTADAELEGLVTATSSSLLTLHGIGPSGAARLLGDVGDVGTTAARCRRIAHMTAAADG